MKRIEDIKLELDLLNCQYEIILPNGIRISNIKTVPLRNMHKMKDPAWEKICEQIGYLKDVESVIVFRPLECLTLTAFQRRLGPILIRNYGKGNLQTIQRKNLDAVEIRKIILDT